MLKSRNLWAWLAVAVAATMASAIPAAAEHIKIGILGSFSGPYADWGTQFKRSVDLYLEQRGNKIAGHTIEILYRDTGGPNPQRARQLAQELVARDGVKLMGGMDFTPNAVAVADVATQTKVPFVIFIANTSDTTRKSPYFVRVGVTIWSLTVAMSKFAIENNKKRAVIFAIDYAPGHDAIDGYTKAYKDLGGVIVDTIKAPLDSTDLSSYFQRIQDARADALFTFVPTGPISVALFKGYVERGLRSRGLDYFGLAETEEAPLAALGTAGEAAIGTHSALFYGPYSPESDANKQFVSAIQTKYGKSAIPNLGTVVAWDGIHVMARMIEATDGKLDGDQAINAVKGYAWESPRGPVSIDAKERDIIQNIYIRRVEKVDGMLINKQVSVIPNVRDPWKDANP